VPASVYTFLTDLHENVSIIVLEEVGSHKTI